MQKLTCPVCFKAVIKNEDLVTDKKVVFDFEKIKTTNKPIKKIKCFNCKRILKYYIED